MPPTKLDIFASAPHYIDHLAPVWAALPKTRRGTFHVGRELGPKMEALGLEFNDHSGLFGAADTPILVASSGNMGTAAKAGRTRIAMMEHGCGLSYGGNASGHLGRVAARSSSYAGGDGREAVSLFLHPGEHPAARDRAKYPEARVEVVGSPRLDTLPKRVPGGKPTVAFSFHWDTAIAPETKSGFIVYRDYLSQLAEQARRDGRYEIIGHGHPRIIDRLAPWYERKGIEVVRSFDDVCRRADLYAVDNSSTLYEFAATGRPVLALNAPFYRKDIHHGLRFWDAIPGPQIDEPYDILRVVPELLFGEDAWVSRREAALDLVYGFRQGAAKRAVKVLLDWMKP